MKKRDKLYIISHINYIRDLLDKIYEEECGCNEGSLTEVRLYDIKSSLLLILIALGGCYDK